MVSELPNAVVAAPTITNILSTHPRDAPALVGRDGAVSYGRLVELVDRRLGELGLASRTVVVLAGTNTVDFVVTYLALLAGNHVPLLSAPGAPARRLAESWPAAAVVNIGADGALDVDRPATVRTEPCAEQPLHPDLALLLATSGSTGSPKLVRLSHRNLISNAVSIVDYLGLVPTDRGITSLPLHYCYGLSVLHAHLVAGASVVVTEASVVDPCFRDALVRERVTNLAGVPHTFDMLERSGPEAVLVPSMRFLTQAGGRLAPDAVARWVGRANERGIDMYVMYGQTEATARMAYLPPDLAARLPGAIGVAVPGGDLRIEPVEDAPVGVGELVYRGDNVMMGYAHDMADLARGAELTELRTGDLARFHADEQVFEIVGRRARFVKPFGVRIDLDSVEHELTRRFGTAVGVTGDDHGLQLVASGPTDDEVVDAVRSLTGLPVGSVGVRTDVEIPRTPSGKIDHEAVRGLVTSSPATASPSSVGDSADRVSRIIDAFEVTLGRTVRVQNRSDTVDSASFTSLGGDSLSYVECSFRLEAVLGPLPADWHLRSIAELAATAPPSPRSFARVDTTIVLRALAICLVVATHMHVRYVPGGAHLLLAVAGYNLARFAIPIEPVAERVRAGLRTVARAAVPVVVWVGTGMVVFGSYGVGTLLLVNNYVGPRSHAGPHWHFWFIEVFVHLVLLTTALLAIPAIRSIERRWQYVFPLVLLAIALLARMEWAWMGDWYNLRYRTHGIAFFFVLGWLVCASRTSWLRTATTAICLAVVPGFFQYAPREWFIATSLVVLLWAREVPFPRVLLRPVHLLAAASMWIYVSHFTLWPLFTGLFVREVAYVLTIGAGVGVWAVTTLPARWLRDSSRRRPLRSSADR